MKKTMKKILSFALVLAMCVSVALPIFAAAPECPGNVNKDHFKTNCTYTYVDTYEPKCTERGYTVYQCNGCGKYFADDFTQNLEQHDYQVTTAPTCGVAGSEKCTKCGDERDVAALEHAWTPSADICGEPGKKITQTCSNCGETREVEITGEHDWTIVVKEEPICGRDGLAIYTCNVCGYEKELAIDCETAEVGGHKWVFVEAVAKTCTTDGNTAGYVCDNEGCDAVAEVGDVIDTVDAEGNTIQVTVASKYEVVPASHETTETYIAATCVTPGYTMYVCTVEGCGYATMEVDPNAPALGHEMPANATVTTTACAIVDGVFVPGKTVTTGICNQCGNNATVTETVNHTYTSTPVAATCTTGAYTVYTCTHSTACAPVDGPKGEPVADAHSIIYIYTGSEDAADYPTLDLSATVAPTCTEEGYGFKACANGCGLDMESIVVPALGHDYGDPVYNCGTGMNDYTCATCGDVKSEPIEGFNAKDYTHHTDWLEDGVWDGGIDLVLDQGCGKSAAYNYTCDDCGKVILVIVTASHTVPAAGANAANAPTCTQDGNYAWFVCDKCDAYCYYDATGALVVIPNAEGATTPELVENSTMPKAVVIAKTGCDIVIDKEYVAPVCGAPGQTAQWHCKNANCDAAATYDGITVDAAGNPMVKAGDEAKLTGSSALSVALTVSHAWTYTDTLVLNHKYEGAATFQTRTCGQYGYNLYACDNCDAWEWRYYAQATDHNIEKTEPECTVNGYYVCTNAWCQHRDALGNLVLNTTNPTYEVIVSEGHVDENGDPIICVAEDFWCAVCNPEFIENPNFDENAEESETNPKMIPSGLTKLPHYESHNTAAEGWKTASTINGILPDKGGMYATELDYSRDCTQWSYIVYVCPVCEDDTKGGHFTVREEAPCTEHHVYDVLNNKTYYAADAEKIPAHFFTEILTPATFAQAGVKGAVCSCPGCEQIVAEREYLNTEIGFDLKVDSAIYAGADIVDSGRIEVDVLVNAYEVYAYSIYFDLAYNANHLEFVEAKLPDGSPFGVSGLDAYATVTGTLGEAHVYLANYGEKLSNIPFDLYGEQLAVVTLVFDVKAVNATGTGKTGSAVSLNDISVLDANGNDITVATDAYNYNVTLTPAQEAEVLLTNSILVQNFDIYMLGNVTMGIVENQNEDARIDSFDALNWEDLYLSGEYLAAADINKNGELDSYDYDYICDYIVKAIDYYELCDK